MDDAAAPIIRKIRECRSLSPLHALEFGILAGFTVMQMLRTRGFQEHMRHTAEATIEALKKKVGEKALPSWLQVDAEHARKEYLAAIPKFSEDFLPHLLDKELILFRTDSACPFIISDHPVALNNTMNRGEGIRGTLGLAVPGIEIYLPISSELTLAFMCPSIGEAHETIARQLKLIGGFVSEGSMYYLQARDMGRAYRLKPENVRFQNSLQVVNAERFLISSISNFTDAMAMIHERPERRRGPRMKVV